MIQLRVPGPWHKPQALFEALERDGDGWQVDEHGALTHAATGRKVTLSVTPHDDDLGEVFRGGHHDRMTKEELDRVENHAVKVHVESPGGSAEAARLAVEAAAALVRAGGFGVFVDNSGACHGPGDFLKLAGDPDPGGLYWTFVMLTATRDDMFSFGMHCLGLRDCRLPDPPEDQNAAAFAIHNFLGYTYQSGAIVTDGDALGSPDRPMFRVFQEPFTRAPAGTPMYNPYGVWRLEPLMGDDEVPM